MQTDTQNEIADAVAGLVHSVRTLQLATLNSAGRPLSSYAPFIFEPGLGFFIFVSDLAAHTGNMRQCPEVGAMIIADEGATRQLFARERLRFDCQAEFIGRDSPGWEARVGAFQENFGAVLKLLRSLGDFQLIALKPLRGAYVRGFGDAWAFEGAQFKQFSHIDSDSLAQNSIATQESA